MRPCSASHATPAKPPLSSSTVPLISSVPGSVDAGARDRFRRVHRRGEARFHVAHAAAEDPAVTHHAGEWIERPPIAGRHDIDVPVQVDDRAAAAPARRDDVHAGVTGRMLGPAVGDDVLDVELALPQVIAEKAGARFVLVARWIDGRNPHEIHRELHDLVGGAIDFRQNAVDSGHALSGLEYPHAYEDGLRGGPGDDHVSVLVARPFHLLATFRELGGAPKPTARRRQAASRG